MREGVVSGALMSATSSVSSPPPPYGSCCTVRSRRSLAVVSEMADEDEVGVVMEGRRFENDASGEKPDAEDDGSGDDVAMMARRRGVLNLMLLLRYVLFLHWRPIDTSL